MYFFFKKNHSPANCPFENVVTMEEMMHEWQMDLQFY